MSEASLLKVLYLCANGVGSRIVAVDTVLRGIFGFRDGDRPPGVLAKSGFLNRLFRYLRDHNERLSYMQDWKDAFLGCAALDVDVCNINDLVAFGRCLMRVKRYDLIVVAHSAAGDDMTLLSRAGTAFDRRRGKLVMFIGNEYDLLDEKIAFIRKVAADFVCSQLPINAARYLYRECEDSRILEMPHALNPQRYRPLAGVQREIDVGFVGDVYWPFIGDRERTELIEWFERDGGARGLKLDIRRQRISREEWNVFLNRCRAVVGAESGTYYLNERGRLLDRARTYNLKENQAATFEDVFERFYAGQPRGVSGKSISSRHFEPIGTKTCQILVEGEYNGILKAGEHYIPVKKDLSDIDAALETFRDESARGRIAEHAYEYVMESHTYAHRVASLVATVMAS